MNATTASFLTGLGLFLIAWAFGLEGFKAVLFCSGGAMVFTVMRFAK